MIRGQLPAVRCPMPFGRGGASVTEAEGVLDHVCGDRRRRAGPAEARVALGGRKSRARRTVRSEPRVEGSFSRHEKAAARQRIAKVPCGLILGPRTGPAEPIAKDQRAAASNRQLLNDPLEAVPFGKCSTCVATREPDIAPCQIRSLSQVNNHTLKITAVLEWDRRPWKKNETGAGFKMNVPLLRRVTMEARVDARRRLTDDDGLRAGPCVNLDPLPVAVHEAGGWIEKIEEGWLSRFKLERRHYAERNLLIAMSQSGPAFVVYEFQSNAADAAGLVGRQGKMFEFRRRHEVVGRDASC